MSLTLLDAYIGQGGRRTDALARALLSDANVELLEEAVWEEGLRVLGPELMPARASLAVGSHRLLTSGLLAVALERGWLALTPRALAEANLDIAKRVVGALSTEGHQQARWQEFREHGVNPAMAPRPEVDVAELEDRLARRGGTFATFGSRPNPFQAQFGGAVKKFSQVWFDPKTITNSDADRIHF